MEDKEKSLEDLGLIELTNDNFKTICDMADKTFNGFEKDVKTLMTKEKAEFIKCLRLSGYTWRAIAAECYEEWKGDWFPHSNQLMGMVLCEEAMKYFENEPDFNEKDW